MAATDLGMFWAGLTAMGVLTILAVFILALIYFHGQRIKESENKFRLLFERVLSPIVLIDENCRITAVNQASCKLLGHDERELRGLQLSDLVSREKWPKLQEEISNCLVSSTDYYGEIALVDKEGNIIQAEMGVTNHKDNGSNFLLASFKDISAHKLAEEAFKEKNIALNEVLARLEEEKLKYKKQVADTIDQTISPVLSKLIGENGRVSVSQLKALEENLAQLAAEAGGMLRAYEKLTPREIEICKLLKGGSTSKDIADTLSISVPTVNKHRERIRKKLILVKKEINLGQFLKQNGSSI